MRKLLLTLGLSCFVVTSSHGMMHLYEKIRCNGGLRECASIAFEKVQETVIPLFEQVANTICPFQGWSGRNFVREGFNYSEDDSAPIYTCCLCWCNQFFCNELRNVFFDLFRRGKFLKKDL